MTKKQATFKEISEKALVNYHTANLMKHFAVPRSLDPVVRAHLRALRAQLRARVKARIKTMMVEAGAPSI